MPVAQFSAWCFTINNPSIEVVGDDPSEWEGVRYCVYQLEVGESGTLHFQGYVIMETKRRLGGMKSLNPRAHWEPRAGTHEQARAYCMKDGRLDGPYEFGDPPHQGRRSDWHGILDLVKAKASDGEIRDAYPGHFARNWKGIEHFRHTLLPQRDWPMEVILFHGPPGSGKSRAAKEAAGPDAFWKDPCNKWFDGYVGEETVVFDEFKGNWFTLSTFLRLLDRYPMRVETKGGSMQFCARRIYITSQHEARTWYPNATELEQQAIRRRIHETRLFGFEEQLRDDDGITYVGPPSPSAI